MNIVIPILKAVSMTPTSPYGRTETRFQCGFEDIDLQCRMEEKPHFVLHSPVGGHQRWVLLLSTVGTATHDHRCIFECPLSARWALLDCMVILGLKFCFKQCLM